MVACLVKGYRVVGCVAVQWVAAARQLGWLRSLGGWSSRWHDFQVRAGTVISGGLVFPPVCSYEFPEDVRRAVPPTLARPLGAA